MSGEGGGGRGSFTGRLGFVMAAAASAGDWAIYGKGINLIIDRPE